MIKEVSEKSLPIIRNMWAHKNNIAIVHQSQSLTYEKLLENSLQISDHLLTLSQQQSLKGSQIAFMLPPGLNYVETMIGIWLSGACSVAIHHQNPPAQVNYILGDSSSKYLILNGFTNKSATQYDISQSNIIEINNDLFQSNSKLETLKQPPKLNFDDDCQIIYTSGTTGYPQGALHTHLAYKHQISDLDILWGWHQRDAILNFLPLNHIHGINNILGCSLHSGATCEFVPPTAESLWDRILKRKITGIDKNLTLFMGVPTIYSNLIQHYQQVAKENLKKAEELSVAASQLRLFVCGSASLPTTVFRKWEKITSHKILQRYGMTQFGMGLSNLQQYPDTRKQGCVGYPLPSLEVKLVDEQTQTDIPIPITSLHNIYGNNNLEIQSNEDYSAVGEIRVRGPNMFKEYINKPKETQQSFDQDQFFKTGDVGCWSFQDNSFKILGRNSVDIIKFGGFQISAIEIERSILEIDQVRETCVFGVQDEQWGQVIYALIVLKGELDAHQNPKLQPIWKNQIFTHCQTNLSKEQIPRVILFVENIPQNQMGKINKKELQKHYKETMNQKEIA